MSIPLFVRSLVGVISSFPTCQSFYQIPLSNNSLKYCGVATPFKGVRMYTRCAMGMPGSETALEELMCHVLGDLLQNGCVAKIADDLYCGGNSPSELLANWRQVLAALDKCDLRLSAKRNHHCSRFHHDPRVYMVGWVNPCLPPSYRSPRPWESIEQPLCGQKPS